MNKARIIDGDGAGEWLYTDDAYACAEHGAIIDDDAQDVPMIVDWGQDLRHGIIELSDALGWIDLRAAFRALPSWDEASRAMRQLIDEAEEQLVGYGRKSVS